MRARDDAGLKSIGLLLLALSLAGLLIVAVPAMYAGEPVPVSAWLTVAGPLLAVLLALVGAYIGWRSWLDQREGDRRRVEQKQDDTFATVRNEIGKFLDAIESIWWGIDRTLESTDNTSLSHARRGFTADSFQTLPDIERIAELRLNAAGLDPLRQMRVLSVLAMLEQVYYLRRRLHGRPPLGVTPEQWQLQMFELCRIHFTYLADYVRALDPQFAARFADRVQPCAKTPDQLAGARTSWVLDEGQISRSKSPS
ncbi:MAG: hypothetical protein ACOY4O_14980 [Pseudomonadota bacterium]|jgi:hypothetical protein